MTSPRLSTNDWAVLGLLAEKPTHGFQLAATFSKKGELGFIWKIQRPQIYRSLEYLKERNLITPVRKEPGNAGPTRVLYKATRSGKNTLHAWLFAPVQHLREGRSDLLLKLAFLERRELDTSSLLKAQQAFFHTLHHALQQQLTTASPLETIALEWRLSTAKAALTFIEQRLKS